MKVLMFIFYTTVLFGTAGDVWSKDRDKWTDEDKQYCEDGGYEREMEALKSKISKQETKIKAAYVGETGSKKYKDAEWVYATWKKPKGGTVDDAIERFNKKYKEGKLTVSYKDPKGKKQDLVMTSEGYVREIDHLYVKIKWADYKRYLEAKGLKGDEYKKRLKETRDASNAFIEANYIKNSKEYKDKMNKELDKCHSICGMFSSVCDKYSVE